MTTHQSSRRRPLAPPAKKAVRNPLGPLPEWNLADLYPAMDAPEVKRDLDRGETECIEFEKAYKGRLADIAASADAGRTLGEAVRRYEAIEDVLGRLISYAGLLYAGNTTDPAIAKFYGDMQERITAASLHLLFFTLDLNRLDDAVLDKAMADPALGHYRPWIEDIRKDKPYQLEDRVEQLFHEKSVTGYSAFNRLFDETMVALRFKVGGKMLPLEQTLNLMQDADPKKRKAAAEALAKTFKENLRLFTLVTNTLAKDKEISDRWRGFADVAQSRHLANRVEPEVVDALVSSVREAYPRLSHRYYALKAQLVRQEAVAALGPQRAAAAGRRCAPSRWPQARETVLTAYGAFSPKMAAIAERFFKDRWIDAPARPGKSPGAFAHPTVPSAHPYVLLNYQGKPRDVMTLAHELGHGVHQVLAAPNGPLMAPTPLTLAETASVFGEMLTFKKLLGRDHRQEAAQGHARRQGRGHDQHGGAADRVLHVRAQGPHRAAQRRAHRPSSSATSGWRCSARASGPAIDLRPGYEVFWTYIPHFIHSPFYVYAYAFGDCLVNSLYAVYERANAGFAERYLEMLAAGGTKHHAELLAPFGLDARDPKFWQGGLGVIERMIGELEALDSEVARIAHAHS